MAFKFSLFLYPPSRLKIQDKSKSSCFPRPPQPMLKKSPNYQYCKGGAGGGGKDLLGVPAVSSWIALNKCLT